jgi:hypothetical protein
MTNTGETHAQAQACAPTHHRHAYARAYQDWQRQRGQAHVPLHRQHRHAPARRHSGANLTRSGPPPTSTRSRRSSNRTTMTTTTPMPIIQFRIRTHHRHSTVYRLTGSRFEHVVSSHSQELRAVTGRYSTIMLTNLATRLVYCTIHLAPRLCLCPLRFAPLSPIKVV